MYSEGQGVDQNYERAVEYYEAAARQGHADAQFNLGLLQARGQGVKQSYETAREWWMKAAEQGVASAIKNLQTLDKEEGRTTPSFIPKPLLNMCFLLSTTRSIRTQTQTVQWMSSSLLLRERMSKKEHWKQERNGHKKRCNKN